MTFQAATATSNIKVERSTGSMTLMVGPFFWWLRPMVLGRRPDT